MTITWINRNMILCDRPDSVNRSTWLMFAIQPHCSVNGQLYYAVFLGEDCIAQYDAKGNHGPDERKSCSNVASTGDRGMWR